MMPFRRSKKNTVQTNNEELEYIDALPLPTGTANLSHALFVNYYGHSGGQLVIEASGELDRYTSDYFRKFLIHVLNHHYMRIVISIDAVEFIDSTALGVLVGALKRVRSFDGHLDLVCNNERILKAFRITGLTKVFGIFASVPEALKSRKAPKDVERSLAHIDEVIAEAYWIPVRLYLDDATNHEQVEKALRILVEKAGMEISYEFPAAHHSYWREFGARFRNKTLSTDAIDRRMADLERSIRLHVIDEARPTAPSINEAEAKAVADLISALKETANAVIQIGTVLVLKVDGTILTRNLSPSELVHYERDPGAFRSPAAALRTLGSISALHNGQIKGRHPKTGTVHLARSSPLYTGEGDGEPHLVAICRRTRVPLGLADGVPISCASCRRIAAGRSCARQSTADASLEQLACLIQS